MGGNNTVAPVIIKRKKVVVVSGHHGGAWKVAYADFVTAMMAFFLLMWLLNATTEKQRKGIADYFTPTIAVTRVSGGGDGALGGDSVFAENVLPRVGTGSTSLRPLAENRDKGSAAPSDDRGKAAEDEQFDIVEETLMGRGGEAMMSDRLRKHVITRVTDEGLVIELFETADTPLFTGDAMPTDTLRELAAVLAEAARMVTNPISVEGHTAAYPVVLASDPAWDVSALRAGNFRDLMVENGFADRRVQRLTSHADREPARENPMDVRNNRLEIVFLRQF
jgi:chemotaxis protein MotB